ncbi:2-oxoglutarate (2OG) and Fe(II)-dependent oxygenase superfamily protein [Striga asiatica]|uniref:2-oxoglutarate (2OG) and Fe(II)-dependent oxygenase superfamily protein n=1 Tax=Striga asiatica TaxID=4170 RepID=A0A5A7QL02_STRAF|nr:2-oxoglutarate (2OG) and Fe(II)-dependent oxygenase superfamily protein [Striga asiatica]
MPFVLKSILESFTLSLFQMTERIWSESLDEKSKILRTEWVLQFNAIYNLAGWWRVKFLALVIKFWLELDGLIMMYAHVIDNPDDTYVSNLGETAQAIIVEKYISWDLAVIKVVSSGDGKVYDYP